MMNNLARFQIIGKPSQLDVLLFTRHLATMVKAGIPITEALDTLVKQTKSSRFKSVVISVLKDVENGQSLAKSLGKHGEAFDQFYINLIEISEESGSLDENLEFIALQLSKNYALWKKIQTAMLYPSLILIATIVMGGFISFYVLPQLVDFFEAFDITLPLSTRILLFVANMFKVHGLLIAVGLVVGFGAFQAFVNLGFVKPLWHSFVLHLPILGGFLSNTQLAQFSRNLGVLVKSGVPIAKGIDISAGTLTNLKFKNDLLKIGRALNKGKNISSAIEEGKYNEFPPLVVRMIEVGEKTGKLDESLLYVGDFYEEEIENISKNLTTILEPILLIGIGLVVGFVALAIITPIYELTGSIRR